MRKFFRWSIALLGIMLIIEFGAVVIALYIGFWLIKKLILIVLGGG